MYILSDNIISPLGFTTSENYQALRSGHSALRRYDSLWGLPDPVCASLFTESQKARLQTEGLTFFESLAVASIRDALQRRPIDVSSHRVALVIASTKGNIQDLDTGGTRVNLADSAEMIARHIGITTTPIVVCNACISGTSAQALALRLIESGYYDYVIVNGTDCVSRFVLSGFSSLKAMSTEPCRPFDIDRNGLNLGEASATILFGKTCEDETATWRAAGAAVRNDAEHISNPSKTAEGSNISMISLHGTATLYNDQMEAVALQKSQLPNIPALALKGYYGHTMGAAGILETIISLRCIESGETLPSKGFEEIGVSANINISAAPLKTEGHTLLKLISGFGGCNAAMLFTKDEGVPHPADPVRPSSISHTVTLSSEGTVVLDGKAIDIHEKGKHMLTLLYKQYIGDYPRYYKMDILSKVAFICSELLLQAEGTRDKHKEDRAVILFNHSSAVVSDRAFLSTIAEEYYPSPSVFVYTLPNIATGEIAIRNGYHGETSFYILPRKSAEIMDNIINASLRDSAMQSVITGWVDCDDENHFEAEMMIIKNKDMNDLVLELKKQIITSLNLEEMTPEDIDATAPLFGDDGLGLDSIDALELIVLLEKNYGIRLANASEGKSIFTSVNSIAEYVEKNRKFREAPEHLPERKKS